MSSSSKLGTGGGGRNRGPGQKIVVSWARKTGIESLATGPEGPLKDEIQVETGQGMYRVGSETVGVSQTNTRRGCDGDDAKHCAL